MNNSYISYLKSFFFAIIFFNNIFNGLGKTQLCSYAHQHISHSLFEDASLTSTYVPICKNLANLLPSPCFHLIFFHLSPSTYHILCFAFGIQVSGIFRLFMQLFTERQKWIEETSSKLVWEKVSKTESAFCVTLTCYCNWKKSPYIFCIKLTSIGIILIE